MDETLSRVAYGHPYRIWAEEAPWFFENIRQKHPQLRAWSDRYEPRFKFLVSVQGRRVLEWGTMDDAMSPYFEAAIAELEDGRIDRADGIRILPKWSDGTYRPASA